MMTAGQNLQASRHRLEVDSSVMECDFTKVKARYARAPGLSADNNNHCISRSSMILVPVSIDFNPTHHPLLPWIDDILVQISYTNRLGNLASFP